MRRLHLRANDGVAPAVRVGVAAGAGHGRHRRDHRESCEGFVAGRHESALDVGIDAAGALIAVVAVRIVHRPQQQDDLGDAMDDGHDAVPTGRR